MKKVIAVLVVAASLLSLTACKMKKEMSNEEFQASLAADESKRVAESIKVEEEYSEGIAENVEEIGKTVKNKRLVLKTLSSTGYEYEVIVMDRKGNADYKLLYQFFDYIGNYNAIVEYKDEENKKQVKHDEKARMIVYRIDDIQEATFDELYESYKSETAKEYGYEVIE